MSNDLRAIDSALYMLSLKVANKEDAQIIGNIRKNVLSIAEQVQNIEENCIVPTVAVTTETTEPKRNFS